MLSPNCTPPPDPRQVFVYRSKKRCGCIAGLAVDDGWRAASTAQFVAGEIRRGLFVERVPVEVVHADVFMRCEAHRNRKSGGAA